ncbi:MULTISPECIES: Fic family protein [unclassified Marinobacterium]|uniref:Fic family protein n=1 Tax=unclassified Marinobacterium TaxID=2644139 RepID=UPI0015683C5B|nr:MULTISPECIES: Fic family protein [unclassified Marinobacterium]NRP56627.1 Fic/DOC family protein [Marinobacterium sp. xm-d-510]NRP96584.1 Fic/DOC family protein [Marinobacterium sp. xm-a-127]
MSDLVSIESIIPNKETALMLAQREVSVLVHDSVLLEGINITLPEVQTLLEGVTVGGHSLSDQQITLNQGNAWRYLFKSVKEGGFELASNFACSIHEVAGKEEALEWGKFRSSGVTIAGTSYMPPDAALLSSLFEEMVATASEIVDVYDRAIFVFLTMARQQFFYDVNKRTGRLMMNGILLSNGYPALNLPASRQLEFNQLMLDFYESGDQSAMNRFMRTCIDRRVVKIMSEGV